MFLKPNARRSAARSLALSHVKRFLPIMLMYLGVLAVVLIVLHLVFTRFGVLEKMDDPSAGWYLDGQPFGYGAHPWFMLVMGLIESMMIKERLAFGLIRRQVAKGMLMGSALHAFLLVSFSAIIAAFMGEFYWMETIGCLISTWLFYLYGWLIAVGFQYKRLITSAGGILAFTVLSLPFIGWLGWASIVYGQQGALTLSAVLMSGELLVFGTLLAAECVLLAIVLPKLYVRIAVKC
jgi:hypothetical protein